MSLFSRVLTATFRSAASLAPKISTRSYQIPTKTSKSIKVYQPLPKLTPKKVNLVNSVEYSLIQKHDPTGWRTAFIKRDNPKGFRPGDIIRVIKNDKTHFTGMLIAINRNGLSSSFLLRNKITGLGVETRYMIYSPIIKAIELIRRPVKPKRRAKLYYVRGSAKHDVREL